MPSVKISGKALALLLLEDIMTFTTTREQDRQEVYGAPQDVNLIAAARPLDGFGSHVHDTDGVDVRELAPGTVVVVHTRHSRYRLVVLEPEALHVLVSGGASLSVPTEAYLVGATGGGSMLKLGWIAVGLRMELLQLTHRTTTSPVGAVIVEEVGQGTL
jgi:hypothetical protein